MDRLPPVLRRSYLISLLALASGCQTVIADPPCAFCTPIYTQKKISPYSPSLKPRRIVVVTIDNRQDRLKEQDRFAETMAIHLQHCNQFDVILSRDRSCFEGFPQHRGQFNEKKLIALTRQHNADAVLYCEVQSIAAYDPMRLQVSILLVSTVEAVALVSAHSTFDLNDPSTRNHYCDYATKRRPSSVADTHLHSPSQLIDFASFTVAGDLAKVWKGEGK